MDVRIKLSLQGGHLWEFCCDEDDPIVFGLVSALPGADGGANLPPDGLVQIETRMGERLFLTRSSLISVEVVPIPSGLQFRGAKRLTAPSASVPEGMSGPSPFVLTSDALPSHVHRALLEHSLAQGATASPQKSTENVHELSLGALTQQVAMALRWKVEKSRTTLGVPDPLETHARFRLFAIGNTGAVTLNAETDDVLYLVYHFYKQPKMFTGGGIRLFDSQIENSARRVAFRDLEIEDNSLLIFPANVVTAGLPARCVSPAFADGLFVVCGALRRTGGE